MDFQPTTTWQPADRLRTVTFRPMRPDDGERMTRFFGRLSQETIYKRFFSPMPRLTNATLTRFVGVDHHEHEALVALVHDEIIGVAGFDRVSGHDDVAEAAIMVEDAWQRRGIGRSLLRRLGDRAVDEGITAFEANVLATNDAPVKLARAVAPFVGVSFDGTETHLDIPLNAPGVKVSVPASRPQPRPSVTRTA